MVGGYKMHVWSVKVVDSSEELPVKGALPGVVLALTGKGMWVQCGEGQLQIIDTLLDDLPDKTPFELVAPLGGQIRILLG